MKHLEIWAHFPDGHTLDLGYAENWRRARARLRHLKKDRPQCTFTIHRRQPEARWILNAWPYRTLRNYDRNLKREANGHPFKFL